MRDFHENVPERVAGNALRLRSLGRANSKPARSSEPPIYYVVEIETTNPDAYARDFAPQAQAIVRAAGGRFLAMGGSGGTGARAVTAIEGQPPKRVVVMVWDTWEQIHAWWHNSEYAALRKVVDKYTTFRSFAVDGQ